MGISRISAFIPPEHSALIIVDVQNDFCPGGSLAVPNGDEVVEPLNAYVQQFLVAGRPIFFSRDWHRPDAEHFKTWPPHCVQNTLGAAFHPSLFVPETATVITKGDERSGDAYSAFEGHNDVGVPLNALLKQLGITMLYVGGLATDYCVKATVIDGRKNGYDVRYLMNASRAVNLKPDDGDNAEAEMEAYGTQMLMG